MTIQREVNRQREPFNRLGYALQLCTLRYLGFVPTDFTATPEVVVTFVAEQLGIAPRVLALYDNRRPKAIIVGTCGPIWGFVRRRPWMCMPCKPGCWHARSGDKPTLLLQLACEKLYRERIVRPGVTRLERFVATAREQAHEETFRQLTPLLTDERKTLLDGLLQPDATTGRTLLSWLRQEAVSHAASHIIATLTKIVFLHDAGVDQWHLASLNPNRAKWLAQIGWKSTNQALQRMAPERRYPVLVAFLQQALLHHTDIAVELFDQCVWGCHSEAKQELEEFRKAVARSTNEKLKLFRELGTVLLDDDIEDPDVRAVSFERVPKKVLHEAIEETRAIRPRPDDAIDFFGKRYSYLRQFVPLWLQTLTLRAQGPDDTVLRAVEVIRDLDRVPTRRQYPKMPRWPW